MKINPFPILLFPLILFPAALWPQDLLELDAGQRCVFTGNHIDPELYRFPDSRQIRGQVEEIAMLGGTEPDFELIQANVDNTAAIIDSAKRYLLYSLDFVEQNNSLTAFGALAHAVGHHANGHRCREENRRGEELEADQFMGYVLAQKGFSMLAVESLLKQMPSSYDLPYDERRAAVQEGFGRAERSMRLKSLAFDNDPQLDNLTLPGFPWPPPSCHAKFELPEISRTGLASLGDADRKLRLALDAKGYAQRSYFSVPGGFALVTQMEQYNDSDGSVRNDRTRWLDHPAKDNFNGVLDYLKSLVVPQKGYFRLFVFVVTNQSFGGGAQRVSKLEAAEWLSRGFNKLPRQLAAAAFTTDHAVTTLVYEFEVPESNQKPRQTCPAPLFDARTHLFKSGIAAGLGL